MLDLAGKTLGPYQLLDRIEAPGAGRVYRARHGTTGRYVAVKVFAPGALNDTAGQERFREKAATLAGLQHPNIVAVKDYGTADDVYYLVMDYIDGPDLRRMLQERRGGGPPLDAPHIAQVINAVGSALDFAHRQGVLHLDIKPSNILRGAGGQIYLTDFGSTRLVASGHVPDGNGTGGAAAYLSPEQASGTRVDTRADLYSLGVVLHEMLTGAVPTASGTAPALPPGFAAIVQKALAPAPAARYQTAAELIEAVQQAIPTGTPAPVVAEDDFRVVAHGTDAATREMIICPNCHGLNPPGSRFCDQCASPLPDLWAAAVSMPAPPPATRPTPPPTPPPTTRQAEAVPVSLPVARPASPDPAVLAPILTPALSAPVSPPNPAPPTIVALPTPIAAPSPAGNQASVPPISTVPIPTVVGGATPGPGVRPRRRDPALLMIGGAMVALVLFLAVTAAALVLSNSGKATPTPSPLPIVNGPATQLALETEQLHATQTALVGSDTSPAIRATTAAQGTATMAVIQATGTALLQQAAAATQTAASAPSPTAAANAPATAAAAQTEAAQGQATATAQTQLAVARAAQATGTAQALAQVIVATPTTPPPPPPSPTRPAVAPTTGPNTQATANAQATTAARRDATAQAAQAAQTSAARSGTIATAQALARTRAQATAAAQAAAQAAANAQATAKSQSNANAQATANAQAAAAQAAAAQATANAQATINAQKEAAAQQAAVNAQNTRIALTAAAQSENAQETQIANQFRAGQTATAAAAAARPTTPPNPCANVPASQSGSISPTCGRTGTVFQISINGFVPNEPISFWLTAPDGRVVGTSSPLDVGSHAASLTDEFDSSVLTGTSYDLAGNWAITYQGATSGHQSIVRFKIIR